MSIFNKVFKSRDKMPAYGMKLPMKKGVPKPMQPERIKRAPLNSRNKAYRPSDGTGVGY